LDLEAFAASLLAAFFFVPLLALVVVAAFVFLTGLLFVIGLFAAVALPVFFVVGEATAFLVFTVFADFFSSEVFVALDLVVGLRVVMIVSPNLLIAKSLEVQLKTNNSSAELPKFLRFVEFPAKKHRISDAREVNVRNRGALERVGLKAFRLFLMRVNSALEYL
jgi:hypothetical protein